MGKNLTIPSFYDILLCAKWRVKSDAPVVHPDLRCISVDFLFGVSLPKVVSGLHNALHPESTWGIKVEKNKKIQTQ